MGEQKWTDSQKDAIFAHGGSILVSAAAGSGKTAVLVQRVIEMLTNPSRIIDADRLLIATFSNAAAAEMRDRISAKIRKLLLNNPEDKNLQRQQILLSKAKISTIHSFCMELLREHFDKLNLDAKFRIADQAELEVLRSDAMEEVLEEFYSSENQEFKDLIDFYCVKDDKPIVELTFKIYDFLRSQPFPMRLLDNYLLNFTRQDILETEWIHIIFEYVGQALDWCGKLIQNACESMPDDVMKDKYYAGFQDDLSMVLRLKQLCDEKDWDGLYYSLGSVAFTRLGQLRNYDDIEKKEYVIGLRDQVKKTIGSLKNQVCCSSDDFCADMQRLYPIVRALFDVVRDFDRKLEELKREKRVLDFSDLEQHTIKLLVKETKGGVEKTEIAKELSDRFEEILLDEYQDTNAAQDLIFSVLSKDENNIFMVGDVKQSIYRFRQAMPDIFIQKSNRFSSFDGKSFPAKIILGKNFRSRKQVCETTNFIFSQIMSPDVGEISYGEEEQLYACADYAESAQMSCELHIVEQDKEDSDEEDKDTLEAKHVAETIGKMLSEGFLVQDKDGKIRKCENKDFCILLRTMSKADIFIGELQKCGIEAWSDAKKSYFDSREISVMINFLRIIDNPVQDVPLLSVLMSPLFGFSGDEVTKVRLADKNAKFYVALLEHAKQGDAHSNEFLQILSDLRTQSVMIGLESIVQKIYEKTDFIEIVGAMRQGEQRQANLRLFLEYARQYEDIGYGGLSGFIRFIDKAIREGHDFSGANTASENANVVKVMSVHRSKGLEFPICFLSDCSKKFNTRDLNAGSLIHSTLGFSTKVREPQKLKQYSTAPHEALKLQLEKEALSEEMRILYVALTRAKEKLIITLSLKNAEKKVKSISAGLDDKIGIVPYVVRSAGSYADWLLMTAARQSGMQSLRSLYSLNTEVLEEQSGYKTFVIASHDKEESAQEEIKIDFQSKPNDAILSQLRNNLDFEYQDEDLSKIPAKLSVTDITKKKRGEQTQLRERPDFFKKDHLTPSERGTIVHKFMQFADYHNARKDLMSEIERLLVDGFLTESETKALSIQKLETFFHSKLMSRILNADEIWREFRFFDEVNAGEVYDDLDLSGEQPQILIQGIADCVIVEGESVSVIDYKTDAVQNPDQLVERYEQQLLLYKKALGKCFEKPINQCIIYSTHLGKEIIL